MLSYHHEDKLKGSPYSCFANLFIGLYLKSVDLSTIFFFKLYLKCAKNHFLWTGALVTDAALPVCALFASCLQDLIQLFHHHRCVDLCAFSKHLGLFLSTTKQKYTFEQLLISSCTFEGHNSIQAFRLGQNK